MYKNSDKTISTSAARTPSSNAQSNHTNQLSFIDNRKETIAQRNLIHSIQKSTNNRPPIAQLYKVSTDHIRSDLRHKESHRLFLQGTIDDIEGRLGGTIASKSNVDVDAAVDECRNNNNMDYNQLSRETLTSEKQITNFLNKNPDDEHMYVLDNNKHHVAIRADSVKLPHPTLVGGDPDVDCAGTMRWALDGSVIVDDGSGHFRPGGAKPAEKMLNKIMEKTAKSSFKKKAKKGRRL